MAVLMAFAFVGCQPKVRAEREEWKGYTNSWELGHYGKSFHVLCWCEREQELRGLEQEDWEVREWFAGYLKSNANEFFQSWQKVEKSVLYGYTELQVGDSVFMANDQYVSVRLIVYTFTGGAHGITNFYTFNYDVQNQKFLTNQEILNYTNETQINTQLKANSRIRKVVYDRSNAERCDGC